MCIHVYDVISYYIILYHIIVLYYIILGRVGGWTDAWAWTDGQMDGRADLRY